MALAEHDSVVGERVEAELRRVLKRKLRVPEKAIGELEAYLRRQAEVVEGPTRPSIKVRDPADARILAEASAGRADVLVTGDRVLDPASGRSSAIAERPPNNYC